MLRTGDYVVSLREALVELLSDGTWEGIQRDHRQVGLPWRTDLNPGSGKSRYARAVLDGLSAEDVLALGRRSAEAFKDRPCSAVQNALWWIEARGTALLTEVTRRAIAASLDGRAMTPGSNPGELLKAVASWPQHRSAPMFTYRDDGGLYRARVELIWVTSKPQEYDAYSHAELLDEFDFMEWPDKRVFLFLERLVHPAVRSDEADQREWVRFLNQFIEVDGFRLVETEQISRRPVFAVQRLSVERAARPKNVIFASRVKPDLRFRDAVSNDVEIVTNADKVLVYDRPIGPDGLRWRDLQAWWSESQGITDEEAAKVSLYKRMRSCLPASSPPQRFLFEQFFRSFGSHVPNLPALLPEVWLHWDPKTVQERGPDALARFRMDFLLLMPGNGRVVVEVDGKEHYSEDGRASPTRYAAMVAADRELRLAGYEMYRLGAAELRGEDGQERARAFFEALFRRHGVTTDV